MEQNKCKHDIYKENCEEWSRRKDIACAECDDPRIIEKDYLERGQEDEHPLLGEEEQEDVFER